MKKLISLFKTFGTDDTGAALIEYSILIGLIAALVIVLVLYAGTWVSWAWTQLTGALASAPGAPGLP